MTGSHLRTVVIPRAWQLFLDVLYPPRCGGCDRRGVLFCSQCRASVVPYRSEVSNIENLDILICGAQFQGPVRQAIHHFKYNSDTPLAKPLAELQSEALQGQHFFSEGRHVAPLLIPVPLHPTRVRSRGYNQSELLVKELSKTTGWRVEKALLRTKQTRSQVGLDPDERRENVSGAFEWSGHEVPSHVLLVDDVCTTGATLSECAATLKKYGVEWVDAVTVARAVGSGSDLDR